MLKPKGGILGFIKIGLFLLLCAAAIWVILNKQTVIDWWQLYNYKPSTEVVAIADTTTMIGRGRDMFYVSDPKVESRETFNQNCKQAGEEGSVLGCYALQRVHIYKVSDPRLPNVIEVTAAHEMLHAAYERLDSSTKKRINALIEVEEKRLKDDTHLQSLVALYAKTEPGEKFNELHSILGTEYTGLGTELEAYYKQYFADRAKVVAMAQAYQGVFAASKARIAEFNTQLSDLKIQIDTNTANLSQRIADIKSENTRLDDLRTTNVQAYNQQVPGFNAKVREYNTIARATQTLINQYNGIVVQVNNEAAKQTELNNSLDSNYQPVSTQ